MTLERDQYELGEDITSDFERSKSPGMVVSTRLPREDAERLLEFAERTERSVSQVVRLAIRRFLDEERRSVPGVGLIEAYTTKDFVVSFQLVGPGRSTGAAPKVFSIPY